MNYKWRALFFLWVAFFLQQGTRQIFGATLSSIQGSLGVAAVPVHPHGDEHRRAGPCRSVHRMDGVCAVALGLRRGDGGLRRVPRRVRLQSHGVALRHHTPRYHASGAGIMLSCAFVFGSTSPVVLGILKDRFSSTVGLASLAGFYLAGAAIIFAARWREFAANPSRKSDNLKPKTLN